MKVITDLGYHEDFALILEINDDQLARIKKNKDIFSDMEFMKEAVNSKGNNAHIVQLTINNDIVIAYNITRMLKKYDSVSWVRDNNFYIRRKK